MAPRSTARERGTMGRMTVTVTSADASRQFGGLLARVERGEEVIIERDGRAVARIVPEPPRASAVRVGGTARGLIIEAPGWELPLTDEEMADLGFDG